MTLLPLFQAQNPAISHYPLGWASCTAFVAAMVGSFDRQLAELCTGAQVRTLTRDTVGGLNLAQVDQALNEGWRDDLDTIYNLPWADFAKRIDAGEAAILQGGYGPIARSRFNAGRGFKGNHAIAVMPGWVGMDPLADGLFGNYRYKGEAYPPALLKAFAAELNFGSVLIGPGRVYASFSRPRRTAAWRASVTKSKFGLYVVNAAKRTVTSARAANTGGFSATCTPPGLYSWAGHSSQRLVVLTGGSLAAAGRKLGLIYAIRATYAKEV